MRIAIRLIQLAALVVVGFVSTAPLHAQGPENTIVVVNAESPDSLAVANHYVSLRGIPGTNIIYVTGVTTKKGDFESSQTSLFLKQVWEPVTKAIKDRGLTDQITCVTYSAGFPTRINCNAQVNKYLKQAKKEYNIRLHAPLASITSVTYFHENVFSKRPTFLVPNANRYAVLNPGSVLRNPFVGELAKQYAAAKKALEQSDYEGATGILSQLVTQNPNQVPAIYALARATALSGDGPRAIELLANARSKGLACRSFVNRDLAFVDIKSHRDFKRVLSSMEDLKDGVLPTRGFSGGSYWSANGWPNSVPTQGSRYMLSTVLALTGRGQSTLGQALAQLETSVNADGTHPGGNVYFAKHKDPRSRTRHSQFEFAVAELNSLGRSAGIIDQRYPENDPLVVGATLGSPLIDWQKTGSRFVPGALCDNFTSHGASWGKNQTHLTDFLNAGAAGASGTVYEPYTIATKIPNARLHAHYARGCTLAESFYQSISSPFQLLIVGDALCCPFGQFPQFKITAPADNSVVRSDFELNLKFARKSPKVRHYEIFLDGVFTSTVDVLEEIEIAIDKMTDGFHELRVVAVADSPAANRGTRRLQLIVDRKGQRVSLEADSSKVRMGRKFQLSSESTFGGKIKVYQNSRVVASTASGDGTEIEAANLGLGKTQLQAVATASDGSVVASPPLEIEIVR